MPKFRKKPVIIDAVLYDWNDADRFAKEACDEVANFIGTDIVVRSNQIEIMTLEGSIYASKGDWIICGIQGEFYPCKPDIFAATYEAV